MAVDINISSIFAGLVKTFKHMQFGSKTQLAFLEDFYTLISDGIPANRSIDMMAKVTTGISREVAIAIATKISEGQPLAQGMSEWFSPKVVEIIRVGEEGGALVETVQSSIKTMSQQSSSISGLISAVTYPLMVITLACVIIVYLDNSVFNQFREIKPIALWPKEGRDLVAIAGFLKNWWWLTIIVVFGIILLFRYMLNNYIGELRTFLDTMPPFNLYRKFVASRFLETLGLLVSNGIVFKKALKVMQYQANPYLLSHLITMEHLLGKGKGNIADVLSTGLIAEKDLLRLRVMAEVKGFEHGLVRIGIRGAEENITTLNLIARILGGLLLIVGAFLVLIIVRGIYMTAMSMGQG